jgi:hypothetical protein
MAANSLLETTRSLRLYVPQLPITLAQQFIRDRYRRILDRKDWSGTRREGEFLLSADNNAGTVSVTRAGTTVTGTGTAFAATDVGRQFKVGLGSPIYTISTVNTVAQTLVIDRAYGGSTVVNGTYHIVDAFATAPTDFLRFIAVIDPLQGFRLRHWITQDELMSIDPQRNSFGSPICVVDRMFSTGATPRPGYEIWPYSSTDRTIYYHYFSRPADLVNDTDVPIWPLRSDVLVAGALADVARWPGTNTTPNPYFSRPDWWKTYELEFEDKMIELERRDEEVYMTWLGTNNWATYGFAPVSANFLQSHVSY